MDRQVEYKPQGRYQTPEQAEAIHNSIVRYLHDWRVPYTKVDPGDLEGVLVKLDEEYGIRRRPQPLSTVEQIEKSVLQALFNLHIEHGFSSFFTAHQVWLQASDMSGRHVSQILHNLLERGRVVSNGISVEGTLFAMDSIEQQKWRDLT